MADEDPGGRGRTTGATHGVGTILIPTDSSEASRRALVRARILARRTGAELVVLPVPGASPTSAILRHVRRHPVDLVVLAGQSRWGGRLALLGSVADDVARHAPCPVLVERGETWPEEGSLPFAPLLVAVDFSPPSRAALAYARELAERLGAGVDVLHVLESALPPPGSPRLRKALLRELAREARGRLEALVSGGGEAPGRVAFHLRTGPPARAVAEFAREERSGLIVVGAKGRTGDPRVLMGRVAEELLWLAPCPVLTVKAAGVGGRREPVRQEGGGET